MNKIKNIQEDVPVTTTNNGGNPLISPELPINKSNVLTRYRKIKSEKEKTLNKQ